MTTMHKATIGSISTGTLRNEDLLQAFADELADRIKGVPQITDEIMRLSTLIREAREVAPYASDEHNSPLPGMLVDELQEALNDYAPPFCYFGSLESDGADFGFWPDREAIQELIDKSTMILPLTNNGNLVCVNAYEGLYIHVNDDGHVTISKLEPGEVLLEGF